MTFPSPNSRAQQSWLGLFAKFTDWRTTLLQKQLWRTFYHFQGRRCTRFIPGDRRFHLENLNGLFGNLENTILSETEFTEHWTRCNYPVITLQRINWQKIIFYLQIVHGRFWSAVVFQAHALYVILFICTKPMIWQYHSVLLCTQLIRWWYQSWSEKTQTTNILSLIGSYSNV